MTTRTADPILETVRPWRPFHCRVTRLRRLSPSFLRVTFGADDLRNFADNGFDQRIKLVFPAEACGFERLPAGDGWYTELRSLPDAERCRVRTYTVRAVRSDVGEVDVDMVVHDPHGGRAPALTWALNAQIGDELVLFGPEARFAGVHGGVDFRAPEGARLLIGGDETAAPAIAAILERLPITAHGEAFIEVPRGADELELDAPPEVAVHWLTREGASWGAKLIPAVETAAGALDFSRAAEAVDDIDVDTETLWDAPVETTGCGAYVWLAAEAGVVKTLRRTVRQNLGLPKECGAFMGYWRLGRAAD